MAPPLDRTQVSLLGVIAGLVVVITLGAGWLVGVGGVAHPAVPEGSGTDAPPRSSATAPPAAALPSGPAVGAGGPPSRDEWARIDLGRVSVVIPEAKLMFSGAEIGEAFAGSSLGFDGPLYRAIRRPFGGSALPRSAAAAIPDPAPALAQAREEVVKLYPGARVVSETRIELGGYAGRDWQVDLAGYKSLAPNKRKLGNLRIKAWSIGGQSYTLFVQYDAQLAGDAADADRFIQSATLR